MKKTLFTLILLVATSSAMAQGRGALFSEEDYNKVEAAERGKGWGANLPSQSSLKQYVPSIIGNQGSMGTCVGWSSTYYLATMEYAIGMKLTNSREIAANTFDPYYTYLSCTADWDYFDCQRGLHTWTACEHLVENGVKRFGYETYECGAKISPRIKESNSIIDFTDYFRIFDAADTYGNNIMAVQQAIVDGHPVVFGIDFPMSFHDIGSDGVLNTVEGETTDGGHAMTIVGYDDNAHDGGSFLVVNSWGADWGDNGFLHLKYADYIELCNGSFYLESEIKDIDGNSGCVYGDCSAGYGRYVYSGGDIYEGDFIEGNRAGYGVYVWDDNSHFDGEWEKHERHGYGIYVDNAMGQLGYYWKEGSYNANEVVVNNVVDADSDDDVSLEDLVNFSNPVDLLAKLKEKAFLESLSEANQQVCLYGDCSDGLGLYLNGTDWVYMGYFKGGYLQGQGEMYWLGEYIGHAYIGHQIDGYRDGYGTYVYPSGSKYFGEWDSGNRHGMGAMFFSDGSSNSGEWENDTFEDESLGFGNAKEYETIKTKVSKPDVKDGKTMKK